MSLGAGRGTEVAGGTSPNGAFLMASRRYVAANLHEYWTVLDISTGAKMMC